MFNRTYNQEIQLNEITVLNDQLITKLHPLTTPREKEKEAGETGGGKGRKKYNAGGGYNEIVKHIFLAGV